jgi:hypothetical protein
MSILTGDVAVFKLPMMPCPDCDGARPPERGLCRTCIGSGELDPIAVRGGLALYADGMVWTRAIVDDERTVDAEKLGHIEGRLKRQEEFAGEIEHLEGAWAQYLARPDVEAEANRDYYASRGLR